jgi:hypothetical protein
MILIISFEGLMIDEWLWWTYEMLLHDDSNSEIIPTLRASAGTYSNQYGEIMKQKEPNNKQNFNFAEEG